MNKRNATQKYSIESISCYACTTPKKPSKTSKAKGHLKALERKLRLWKEWNITELVNKSKTIQERLPSTDSQMNVAKLPSKF